MKTIIEKRVILGIVLLFTGVALMLRFFDVIPISIPLWVFSWKSLLIIVGAVLLITEKNKTTGMVLLIIGLVFLIGDIMDKNLWEMIQFLVPLLLIITGIAILLRKPRFSKRENIRTDGTDINDFINDVSVFGGGEKKVKSQNFKGGQLTVIFGGSEIDLRTCELSSGVNSVDILCLFGGITIKVPHSWHVKGDVRSLFGGYTDERSRSGFETDTATPEKILYLKGSVIFGGVDIKN